MVGIWTVQGIHWYKSRKFLTFTKPTTGRIYTFSLITTAHFMLQSCRQNFLCILFYRLPRTDSVHLTNEDDANSGNNYYEDTDWIIINNFAYSSTIIWYVVRNSVQRLSVFLISNSCHPWSIDCTTGGDTSCYAVPTFSVYRVRFFLFINLIT